MITFYVLWRNGREFATVDGRLTARELIAREECCAVEDVSIDHRGSVTVRGVTARHAWQVLDRTALTSADVRKWPKAREVGK